MTYNGKPIVIEHIPFTDGAQGKVHGLIAEQSTRYIILIDSTQHPLIQRKAVGHELAHLYLNHFHNGKPVAENELEANRRAWHFYRAYKRGTLPA